MNIVNSNISSPFPVVTLIATSNLRTETLLSQALPSVLSQSYLPQLCLIVDDNTNDKEYEKISNELQKLQKTTTVELCIIRNCRIKGYSGTGAWNTGIAYSRQYASKHAWEEVYIAILDDDDYWDSSHLKYCVGKMGTIPDAIFCNLTRVYTQYSDPGKLTTNNDLTISNFLEGNPGIQGSNMCFRLSVLEAIEGFDESLKSCTDRDLLIRFLEKFGNKNIEIIKEQTVFHDARSKNCVTNNKEIKTAGLDSFYKKHLWRFDEKILERSLIRAKRLFAYDNMKFLWSQYYKNKEIIAVIIPFSNNSSSIRKAIYSVISQKGTKHPIVIFLGDDNSKDDWRSEINDFLDIYHNIIKININGGSAAKARNSLTEYIFKEYPHTYMLCRLDADDELYSPNTLSDVEQIFTDEDVRAVLCSNYQISQGKIVGKNCAHSRFYDREYMRMRLFLMSQGNTKAELPSCNLCIRPDVYIPYPEEYSAEDHWLVIKMLLQFSSKSFRMVPELIYCNYSLDGTTTQTNKNKNKYINSRTRLYEYYNKQTNR